MGKGALGKMVKDFLPEPGMPGQGTVVLNQETRDRLHWIQDRIYDEDTEAKVEVAQRSCGCPMSGSAQSQVGKGLEHPREIVEMSLPMAGRED